MSSAGYVFSPFSLVSGAGTGKATFSGTVTNGVGRYAVYPYHSNDRLANNTLYYYLPDSYTYTSVDRTFFPEGKDGKSFRMPMYGTITGNVVRFRNLGGVICLWVDRMPAESGTVRVTASGKQLCGTVSAVLTDAAPEIRTSESSKNNTVRFDYSNATEGEPGVFYLPAATGTYRLTVVVEGAGKVSTTILGAVTITRAKLQAVKVATTTETGIVLINGRRFVDLGLPSGLLWAETNIGVETEADAGHYFAWGETTAKEYYDWSTYGLGTGMTSLYKYNGTDGKTVLDPEDDAATANWGTPFRMPASDEFVELVTNCTLTTTTRTASDGSTVRGLGIKSNTNGNSIFLPAAGICIRDGSNDHYGWYGYYWLSIRDDHPAYAQAFSFYSSVVMLELTPRERCRGCSVRPVAKP